MYGRCRKYGKLSISAPEPLVVDPNHGACAKTIVMSNTRNTSDETIIRDSTGIERKDDTSVSYEPFRTERLGNVLRF